MSDVPTEQESLPVHVAVCGQRYLGIETRLKTMERLLYAVIAMMFANGSGLTPLVAELLKLKH